MLPGMHIQENARLRGEVHPLIIESYIISRYFVGRFIPLRSSRTNHKFVLPLRKVRQPFDRPRNLISLVAVPFRRQEHGFHHHHIIGFRIIITIQVTIAVVAAGAFLSFLQHFSSAALPVTDGKRSLRGGFAPSVTARSPPRPGAAHAVTSATAIRVGTIVRIGGIAVDLAPPNLRSRLPRASKWDSVFRSSVPLSAGGPSDARHPPSSLRTRTAFDPRYSEFHRSTRPSRRYGTVPYIVRTATSRSRSRVASRAVSHPPVRRAIPARGRRRYRTSSVPRASSAGTRSRRRKSGASTVLHVSTADVQIVNDTG